MDTFQKYFGTAPTEIKKHCIICPSNDSGLFSCNRRDFASKGLFFNTTDAGYASIITTRYNFLVGDCVLHLKNTNCSNIYLFGSCGSTGKAGLGSKILIQKSVGMESFTEMLKFNGKPDACFPDTTLLNNFLSYCGDQSVSLANCATVSSLILEEIHLPWLVKNNIACVDMEASIVFSAASYVNKKAIAFLYATDIILKKPFHEKLTPEEYSQINAAKKASAELLCGFIKNAQKD